MHDFGEPGTLQHRDWLVDHLACRLQVVKSEALQPDWQVNVNAMFNAMRAVRAANEAQRSPASAAANAGSEAANAGCEAAHGGCEAANSGRIGEAQPKHIKVGIAFKKIS